MSYFWQEKKILVLGGTGFLGSHVVEKLKEKLDVENIKIIGSKDYDLTREESHRTLFKNDKYDLVFHLAGLVGGIGANKARPAEFFYNNIMMGVLSLHYAFSNGAEKVIAAGAGCGYPEEAPLPLKEEDFWKGFPQIESAPYSLAKRMLHIQSLAYYWQYRFPIIVCIPGNIYGPYDNFNLEQAHVVPALVRKFVEATDNGVGKVEVWGSGKPTRDFIYAGDVAEGMLKACEVYDSAQLVNLSSGEEHSIREVVDIIVDITGFKGRVEWNRAKPDGQARRVFDISKAVKELNFKPKTSLYEGLRLTIEWFRDNYQKGMVRL